MQGFVRGRNRQQTHLLPECLDIGSTRAISIRAVDVFVEALDLRDLGFEGVDPAATGPAGRTILRGSSLHFTATHRPNRAGLDARRPQC